MEHITCHTESFNLYSCLWKEIFRIKARKIIEGWFFVQSSLVTIDITDASFLDNTSVEALDKVVFKFRKKGAYVEVSGMDTVSGTSSSNMRCTINIKT